jgi:hypothetical protein
MRLLLPLLLLLSACSQPSPPPATPAPAAKPSPSPEPSPIEAAVHIFLWGNPDTTQRDLQLARDGGFRWVKQRFEWRNIEGKAKGSFEWHEPDRIVDAISQMGLKIVARVDNQPQWAARSVQWPGTSPPDNPTDWTDYLSALAQRYRGRIAAYEIWNEPNLDREWGDRTPNPREYTDMLRASYQAIKAADPQALVITAGMSPTTTNNAQAMPDLDYYAAMYAAGARGSFDMLGIHAPPWKADPCADPAVVAQDPTLTNQDPSPVNMRRIYAFRHAEDIRQLMVQQGDADKQIAVLEMGATTDQRPGSPYAWFAVDRATQGTVLVNAFRCAVQHFVPWMAFMTVIYIPEPAWTQNNEQYWWSITNPDGSVRPAYTALKGFLNP